MKRKKSHNHIFSSRWLLPVLWSASVVFLILIQSCKAIPEEENSSNTPSVDSLDYYTNLIATNPAEEVETAYVNRSRLFYKRKAYDAALKDLRSALKIDSTHMETYLLKSQVELDYFRSIDALRTLQKAEKQWPESILIKEHLAQTHLILRQYTEAREKASQAIKINPLSARPYLILGMAAIENKDTTSAISYLQEAVQNDADLLDGWIELARLQMIKNPVKATTYFESALQVAPGDLRIWHAYAMYWQDQDSLHQAKKAYDQMINLDSQYLDAYYNKALILMDQDSFQRAIPLWDQYILRADDPAKGYYYRGISYEVSENFNAALEDYQKAKNLNPELENIDKAIQSVENQLH